MKKYNIVIPKNYQGRDGSEKTQWNTVGTLVEFPATETKPKGFVMELSMFPNTTFKVFEQKEREDKRNTETQVSPEVDATDGIDSINPEDIPF